MILLTVHLEQGDAHAAHEVEYPDLASLSVFIDSPWSAWTEVTTTATTTTFSPCHHPSPGQLVTSSPSWLVTLSLNVSLQVVARYPWKRLKHLDLNGRLSCRVLQVDSTIVDQRANHYVSRLL